MKGVFLEKVNKNKLIRNGSDQKLKFMDLKKVELQV